MPTRYSQGICYKFAKEIKGKEVASLYFYYMDLPSRKLGVIEEVNTLPTHRRKGYATELLKEAIALAKVFELDCLELTVRKDKPEIKKFYEGLGFTDRLNHALRLKL